MNRHMALCRQPYPRRPIVLVGGSLLEEYIGMDIASLLVTRGLAFSDKGGTKNSADDQSNKYANLNSSAYEIHNEWYINCIGTEARD